MRTSELHRHTDHAGHEPHDHDHGDHDHGDHDHGDHDHDHHDHDHPWGDGKDRRSLISSRGRRALIVAATVAAVTAGVVVARGSGSDRAAAAHVAPPIPAAAATPSPVKIPAANDPAASARGAASADAAVTTFLDAEIGGDTDTSFGVLSLADRTQFGSAQAWGAAHDQLPTYLEYRVTEANGDRIITDVTLDPQLDESVGFVPAHATVTWQAVQQDGSWHIALDRSESVAVLPSDDAIAVDASAWVAAREKCTTAQQYDGSLLGQPTVADQLCGGSGNYTAGEVKALDAFPDPTVITTAFGSDASTWTRVVDMSGPKPFTVALAPFDDRWVVVAVARR